MSGDEALNLKFVKLIEQYPCLYDTTWNDLSKRTAALNAWEIIGEELNLSVNECKRRWKNLRTSFAQNLRKDHRKHKEYYLKDAIQFLIPYMRPNPQNSQVEGENYILDNSDANSDVDNKEINLREFLAYEVNNSSNDSSQHMTPTSSKSNPYKRKLEECYDDVSIVQRRQQTVEKKQYKDVENGYLQYETLEQDPLEINNSDLEFLKSLLPDLCKMTDYQKRQFKKKTLDVIDTILNDGPKKTSFLDP